MLGQLAIFAGVLAVWAALAGAFDTGPSEQFEYEVEPAELAGRKVRRLIRWLRKP